MLLQGKNWVGRETMATWVPESDFSRDPALFLSWTASLYSFSSQDLESGQQYQQHEVERHWLSWHSLCLLLLLHKLEKGPNCERGRAFSCPQRVEALRSCSRLPSCSVIWVFLHRDDLSGMMLKPGSLHHEILRKQRPCLLHWIPYHCVVLWSDP